MAKRVIAGIITKPLGGDVQTNGATTSGVPVSKPNASENSGSSGSTGKK